MTTATYTPSTSSSDLNTLWRKVQVGILLAYQFGVPEWNLLKKMKDMRVDWSAREMTAELDLVDDYNVASIPEGGKEARPNSVKPVTATFTWILLNARFTMSMTARYIQQQQGNRPQLISQFKQQSKTKVRAIQQYVGNAFYGFSTGVIGHLTANNTGTTSLDLDNMYGVTSLGGTSAGRRVVDLLDDGGSYAILESDGTFREIVAISSVDRDTNIATTSANMSTTADGDLLVGAGSLENTTVAGTDYNRWPNGLLDMYTSASLHNYSSATNARWDVSLEDTNGGRFTGIKLRKMKQAINNDGGGTLDTVIWDQGVENDVTAQLQAGLRFSESFGMEMDGSPASKGVKFVGTKRVPDGYVFGYDSKRSIKRGTLLPEPTEGTVAFDDGHKLQDDSGHVFSIDYPYFMFCQNRKNLAYYSGLERQGL